MRRTSARLSAVCQQVWVHLVGTVHMVSPTSPLAPLGMTALMTTTARARMVSPPMCMLGLAAVGSSGRMSRSMDLSGVSSSGVGVEVNGQWLLFT